MHLMLDTNVWSYIADEGSVDDLDEWAATAGVTLVVPPSVLMEVARIPREDVFRRIVKTLVTGPRLRLASEAQLEADELVTEARRVHPEWLLSMPQTAKIANLNGLWTKRIWRVASDNPSKFLWTVGALSDPDAVIQ